MKYVGIDISKLFFDANNGEKNIRLPNNNNGYKQLLKTLAADSCCVMEATGPYYMKLAFYLRQNNIKVSVVNPLVIKRFIQMRLKRTKTDRSDANMIREYGTREMPVLWEVPESYVLELNQIQTVISSLQKQKTVLLNQQEAFNQLPHQNKPTIKVLSTQLKQINGQINLLEQEAELLIGKYALQQYRLLTSIPGIGKKTAIMLITISNGFKNFKSSKQLASYIGICPRIYESGISVKGAGHICKMGMGRIRAMLYLCSWTAHKCNKACRELYDRLIAKGKAKKIALVAVMHKLLKQAFAIVTNLEPYNENKYCKILS